MLIAAGTPLSILYLLTSSCSVPAHGVASQLCWIYWASLGWRRITVKIFGFRKLTSGTLKRYSSSSPHFSWHLPVWNPFVKGELWSHTLKWGKGLFHCCLDFWYCERVNPCETSLWLNKRVLVSSAFCAIPNAQNSLNILSGNQPHVCVVRIAFAPLHDTLAALSNALSWYQTASLAWSAIKWKCLTESGWYF